MKLTGRKMCLNIGQAKLPAYLEDAFQSTLQAQYGLIACLWHGFVDQRRHSRDRSLSACDD